MSGRKSRAAFRRAAILSAAMLAVCFSRAQAAGVPIPHGTLELIAEKDWITPGHPFNVALRFELEKGWHVYWVNPGDSGEPPRVTWDLPAGIKAGAIEWPAPRRLGTADDSGLRLRGRGHINHSNARGRDPLVTRPGSDLCERQGSRLPRNVHSRQSASFARAAGKIAAASREFAKHSFLCRSAQSLAATSSGKLEICYRSNERLVCAHSEPRPQNHRRNFLSPGRVAGIKRCSANPRAHSHRFHSHAAKVRPASETDRSAQGSPCAFG